MGQIEKIAEINNPAFKTGMGKNGKPWTLVQITTDQNNLATVFGPVNVGDQVEMEWNASYGNWSAKRVNQREVANVEAMRKLYALNLAIYKAVTGSDYQANEAPATPTPEPVPTPTPVAPKPDVVHEVPDEVDEQTLLDNIPF